MDNSTFDRVSRALAGTASRRQALKLVGGGLAGSLVAATGLRHVTAQQGPGGLSIPVTGTLDGDPFSGP